MERMGPGDDKRMPHIDQLSFVKLSDMNSLGRKSKHRFHSVFANEISLSSCAPTRGGLPLHGNQTQTEKELL